MKNLSVLIKAAAVLAVAALWGTPAAHADSFAIGVGPKGGINFSYSSGGYCDARGCPDAFWDMPVYYCPVYYHGRWYRGPVYYRHGKRGLQFWIRGRWRYDAWRGPRPPWACTDRMGPALGFEYYMNHGFHMRPEWRERWHRAHPGKTLRARPNRAGPAHPGPDRHKVRPGDRGDAGPALRPGMSHETGAKAGAERRKSPAAKTRDAARDKAGPGKKPAGKAAPEKKSGGKAKSEPRGDRDKEKRQP